MNDKSNRLVSLLEDCDESLGVARSAGRKLWTAYARNEVGHRREYDELIKITENDALTKLIARLREQCASLKSEQ